MHLNFHLLVNLTETTGRGGLQLTTRSFNFNTIWVPFLVGETAFGARERAVLISVWLREEIRDTSNEIGHRPSNLQIIK